MAFILKVAPCLFLTELFSLFNWESDSSSFTVLCCIQPFTCSYNTFDVLL